MTKQLTLIVYFPPIDRFRAVERLALKIERCSVRIRVVKPMNGHIVSKTLFPELSHDFESIRQGLYKKIVFAGPNCHQKFFFGLKEHISEKTELEYRQYEAKPNAGLV